MVSSFMEFDADSILLCHTSSVADKLPRPRPRPNGDKDRDRDEEKELIL